MTEGEQWRPVVDYEGLYEVSDFGRIRRIGAGAGARVGRILRFVIDHWGYCRVGLFRDGERLNRQIHRLVAEAFLGRCPADHQANHINGLKTDNRAANLEWVTCSDNHRHAYQTGLRTNEGEANPRAKLTIADVRDIRSRRGLVSERRLAQQFGVSQAGIHDIQSGRTWKGV